MLSRHLRIKKYFYFSLSAFLFFLIFFSRNDVSRKRFREAEGEAFPQSPPAGAFLLKKKFPSAEVRSDTSMMLLGLTPYLAAARAMHIFDLLLSFRVISSTYFDPD